VLFSLSVDRSVFADPQNLYLGAKFIPVNEIIKIEINSKNYKYAVKANAKDGSKLTFGLAYKVEKERLTKYIGDHGINVIDA
jgi:hypothetical protein